MRPNATKKGSKAPATGSKAANTASSQGSRKDAVAPNSKSSKEMFLKKLQICMKNYDYKDEHKDVKGKTERLNAITELQMLLQD
jgi:hypothetical protein